MTVRKSARVLNWKEQASQHPGATKRLKRLWKTDKWRKKIAKAVGRSLKELWADPKWRAAQQAKQRAGWAKAPAKSKKRRKKSPAWRKAQSTRISSWWNKNRDAFLTPERRQLISDRSRRTHQLHPNIAKKRTAALKKAWKNPKRRSELCAIAAERLRIQTHHTPHQYTCRKGRQFNFRSGDNFELGCAKVLDERKLTWDYEPRVIKLSDGRAYLPDFWVKEWKTYIEIKGWERRVDKVKLARKDGHPVLLIRRLSELP